jgi:hypothetical protein
MMAFGLIPLWSLIRRSDFGQPIDAIPAPAQLNSSSR